MTQFIQSSYQQRISRLATTHDGLCRGDVCLGVWRHETWTARLSTTTLETLCRTVARHHEILRTRLVAATLPSQQVDAQLTLRWLPLPAATAPGSQLTLETLNEAIQNAVAADPHALWVAVWRDAPADDRPGNDSRRDGDQGDGDQRESAAGDCDYDCDSGTHVLMWLHGSRGDAQTLALLCREIRWLLSHQSTADHGPLTAAPSGGDIVDGDGVMAAREVIQYGDFSEWQQHQAPDDQGHGYWLRQQPREREELPLGRRVSAMDGTGASYHPAWLTVDDSALNAQLAALDESTLLALWCAFLCRCCGTETFTVAVRRDGRTEPELADCMGPLTQYLPLTVKPDIAATVAELQQQCHQQLAALDQWHSDFRWGQHDTGWRRPTLACGFALVDHDGVEMAAAPAVDSSPVPASSAVALLSQQATTYEAIEPQQLRLEIHRQAPAHATDCRVAIHYDGASYHTHEIQVLARQWRVFASAALAATAYPWAQLPLLAPDDQAELLAHWRGAQAEWPPSTVPEQVAGQDARAMAVVDGDRQWRYGELLARAAQSAHYLRSLGVTPGDPVGVCLPRCGEQVIALLAVQLCAAVAVPLDPRRPAARLQQVISDAGCALIISRESAMTTLLETDCEATLVVLERDGDEIAACPTQLPERQPQPDDTAYIIYTSGSSGRPKGIRVSHANISHYARAVMQRLDLPADAHLAALSSVAADLGYTALYGALCTGRCVQVLPEALNLDVHALALALRQRPVTALKIVPSHLCALLAHPSVSDDPSWLPGVLICGGEVLERELFERIRALRPDIRVFNHYGPSETTVGVLCGELTAISGDGAVLGAPLSGCAAYALDEQLQPVAPGGCGQLYIGGATVAQGYLKRDVQTRQQFIADPFQPGGRLYRSGDWVQVTAGGELVFRRRMDEQIKIRGHRVEPQEVAALLRHAPGVRQAVVLALNGQLSAFLCGAAPQAQILERWLARHLPNYLRPAHWHWLPEFPLTANGKVDRDALAQLPPPGAADDMPAPRNALEEELLAVWRQLLKRQSIGVHDNFFQLGGDSILTIQLVARARRCGIVITPQQVFAEQTIAGLARVAGRHTVVDAEQGQMTGDVPLTPGQLAFLARDTARPALYFSNRVLSVNQPLDVELLSQTVDYLLRRHDALRLRFERCHNGGGNNHGPAAAAADAAAGDETAADNSGWRQFAVHSTDLALHDHLWVRSLAADTAPRQQLQKLLESAAEQADLTQGPLCRFIYLSPPEAGLAAQGASDQGTSKHGFLLIAAHQLVIDGVSWRILLHDLVQCYQQLQQRGETPGDLKTSSYREWSRWLREDPTVTATAAVTHQVTHHGRQRDGEKDRNQEPPEALGNPWQQWARQYVDELPQRLCRSSTRQGGGCYGSEAETRRCDALLDATLTGELLSRHDEGDPRAVETLLLAAWAQALQQEYGIASSWVDVESHGRDHHAERLDLSQTCGSFACVIPQPLLAADDPRETLARCGELRRQLPRHDVEYARRRYLQRCPPVVQPALFFTFLGQFDQTVNHHGDFQPAPYWLPPLRGDEDARRYLLECHCGVSRGRLHLSLMYPDRIGESSLGDAATDDSPIDNTLIEEGRITALVQTWVRCIRTLLATPVEGADAEVPAADISKQGADVAQLPSNAPLRQHLPADLAAQPLDVLAPLPKALHGMLSYSLGHPGSPVYKVQNAFDWQGRVDVQALRLVWRVLIQRHQVLRLSAHALAQEQPLLAVAATAELPWQTHDVSGLDARQQEQQFQTLLADTLREDFDLQRAPLMRLHWLHMGPTQGRLLWVYHHAIVDGWSAAVVWRECFTLYPRAQQLLAEQTAATRPSIPDATRVAQLAATLPPASAYHDYLHWLQQQDIGAAQQYWREQYAGAPADPPYYGGLPGVQRAPAVTSERDVAAAVDELEQVADNALCHRLRCCAAEHHFTPNLLCQAAWALVLAGYENTRRVRFGVTLSGRPPELAGVEDLVGFCLHSVPVQLDLEAYDTVAGLLQALRDQLLNAAALPPLPAAQITALTGGRAAFDSLLVCENLPQAVHDQEQLPQVQITRLNSYSYNHYPLTLMIVPGDALYLKAKFNPARIQRAMVQALVQRFFAMLDALCSQMEASRAEHSLARCHGLYPVAEPVYRQALRDAWGDAPSAPAATTPATHHPPATIPQLLEQAPGDAPALHADDHHWTYAQLRASCYPLARYLLDLGLASGQRVAVVLPRSGQQIIAQLAVQLAGGVCVPLDPSGPAAWLQQQLSAADCVQLITAQAAMDELLAVDSTAEWIILERDRAAIEQCSSEPLKLPIQPTDGAYLIHTSGSSGTPKGVLVSHANITHYARSVMQVLDVPANARLTALSGVATDLGYTALYGALCTGRCLKVLPEALNLDAAALAQELTQQPVAALKITPSHLAALLDADSVGSVKGSANADWLPPVVICGGEALSVALVRRLREARPGVRIFNHYGPTETTVGVLCGEVGEVNDDDHYNGSVALGDPLPGCSAYVLDDQHQPVVPGGVGELYLGGAGLTAGYVNDEEQTRARFIATPFGAEAADLEPKLYRSGDRVRVGLGGERYFVGRVDDQVKIRGHRVEPEAVARCLEQSAAVAQAAVVAWEGELHAYLVGREGNGDRDLEPVLATLPAHQRPLRIQWLGQLPLTASGKVDREALRQLSLASESGAADNAGTAPRNATEAQLLQLWRELLQREDIGIHDGFFAVGGDSILVIQMVARARQQLLQLTPQQVFELQTVAALAQVVDVVPQPLATQGEVQGPCLLAPIQRRFFDHITSDPHHYVQSRLYRVPVGLDNAHLGLLLLTLWRHHDALRLQFTAADTAETVAEYRAEHAAIAAINGADLLHRQPVDEAQLAQRGWPAIVAEAAAHWHASLQLDGPLLRAVWLDAGRQRAGRLLLIAHHLVVDGVSWRIVEEDIHSILHQLCDPESVDDTLRLPPKTTAYRDWSAAQQRWAAHLNATETAYWLTLAKQYQAAADPLAGWRDNTLSEAGMVRAEQVMDPTLTQALLGPAHWAYSTTTSDLLLAALVRSWQQVLGGSQPPWLDLEHHGRDSSGMDASIGSGSDVASGATMDLSRTVGWFTTIYPHAVLPPGTDSTALDDSALIKAVKEQRRQVPGQGQGFGLLRYSGHAGGGSQNSANVRLDGADEQALHALRPALKLNYFGYLPAMSPADAQRDRDNASIPVLTPAPEPLPQTRSPRQCPAHALVVDAAIMAAADPTAESIHVDATPSGPAVISADEAQAAPGAMAVLHLGWRFPAAHEDEARRWMQAFADHLHQLVAHCLQQQGVTLTPSDVPEAGLDQGDLDHLLQELEGLL